MSDKHIWRIYGGPLAYETTRYFETVEEAEEWAERVGDNPKWAGAAMYSPAGDAIFIGEPIGRCVRD